MKVRFYIEKNKAVKSKQRAIWCYLREYNDTVALNTGEKIDINLWDSSSQRANPRKTSVKILKGSLKSLNQYLNAYEIKINEITRNIRSKKFNASFSEITDEIKLQFNKRDHGLFKIYEEFLSSKKLQVSRPSWMKLTRVRDLVKEFDSKLTFDKIKPMFFENFYSFLVNQKQMINNTANKNIQFFKSFLIWANTNGFTDNTSFRSFKSKTEQNEIVYLNEDELMSLYKMDIKIERLARVRDAFLFQCFTGVRYSDIQNISWSDIRNGIWHLRTQKTKDILQIPLSSYALNIIERYRNWEKPLPVISNQKMNLFLKELCKEAEINEKVKIVQYRGKERIEETFKKYEVVGTHTARRTFISLSLRKGMKPDVIMAITGHKTYRMMQKYLKIDDSHKREEMDKVWGSSLRLIS